MTVVKAPFYPLAGFWLDKTCVEAVYTFDGRMYHLRQLGRNVFYYVDGADTIEQTRFVRCEGALAPRDWPSKLEDGFYVGSDSKIAPNAGINHSRVYAYPQANFMAQVRAGESGRYALHTSQAYRDCTVVMLLRPDATGTCLYDQYLLLEGADEPFKDYFLWDGRAYGILRPADIVNASWETVSAVCEDALTFHVRPYMADPFVSYVETPDEPFGWLRGSEQGLERLTRCILYTNAKLFDQSDTQIKTREWAGAHGAITITYRAATTQNPGGPQTLPPIARLRRLFELAYADNAFQGGVWEQEYSCEGLRRDRYKLIAETRRFHILPPSAHEQAEALLTVNDWLDGKVGEAERQRLLLMQPPAMRCAERG